MLFCQSFCHFSTTWQCGRNFYQLDFLELINFIYCISKSILRLVQDLLVMQQMNNYD
jgi:hypothetical protein